LIEFSYIYIYKEEKYVYQYEGRDRGGAEERPCGGEQAASEVALSKYKSFEIL